MSHCCTELSTVRGVVFAYWLRIDSSGRVDFTVRRLEDDLSNGARRGALTRGDTALTVAAGAWGRHWHHIQVYACKVEHKNNKIKQHNGNWIQEQVYTDLIKPTFFTSSQQHQALALIKQHDI